MTENPKRVRKSFLEQAKLCEEFGSVFTAEILRALEAVLDDDSQTGKAVLNWQGPPGANGDAVALRLAAALHALVLSGKDDRLALLYPPHSAAQPNELRRAISAAIGAHDAFIVDWLKFSPQTNEVGRSAVLFYGLQQIANRTAQPIKLFEIGSSAGLNLILDRYEQCLSGIKTGSVGSDVKIAPQWSGAAPQIVRPVEILDRSGCDLSPLDVSKNEDRLRLRAYVWPDQQSRLERMSAAIDLYAKHPVRIDKANASDWVRRSIALNRSASCVTVLMHSLTYCYLPKTDRNAISHHMEKIGKTASSQTPLAWLQMELNDQNETELTLQFWPGGEKELLAKTHPHGRFVVAAPF